MESLITAIVIENVTMLKKPKMDGVILIKASAVVPSLSNQFVEKMESPTITLAKLSVSE